MRKQILPIEGAHKKFCPGSLKTENPNFGSLLCCFAIKPCIDILSGGVHCGRIFKHRKLTRYFNLTY